MVSNGIPTFIFEEHHEAFYVWNHAISKGFINSAGNSLYHVDEHSDMRAPLLNYSLQNLNGDLRQIKKFTYQELTIDSFIVPAIYKDIFNKIYWIKQKHTSNRKAVRMYVRSFNHEGKKLFAGKVDSIKHTSENLDSKEFELYLIHQDKMPRQDSGQIVLDIDLDYFSCSGNPNQNEPIRVEITEKEFDNFNSNPYHRILFCGFYKVQTERRSGKFYYIFNRYDNVYQSQARVTKSEIVTRIKSFAEQLEKKRITPGLIEICRSRHSGYTPKDQWEFIERQLMKNLRNLYSINVQ